MTSTDLCFLAASGWVLLPLAFATGMKRGVKSAQAEMMARKPMPKPVLTVALPRTRVPERSPVINPRWLLRDRPLPR